MAISKEFADAVDKGKLMRVRIMLKDSLLLDPSGAQFDEMSRYAEKKMKDLYVEHDDESLNEDESSWTKDYLNEQMVAVVNNFSKKRINLLKRMVRVLFKDKLNKIKSDRSGTQEFVKIRKLLRDLAHDLWELIKSLGSRDFSAIKNKWRTLCQKALHNIRGTHIYQSLSGKLNKTPNSTAEAREQIEAIRDEVKTMNEAAALLEAVCIYEEYQTDDSPVYQENQPESKTPYVHRVEYNFYDPNLMDLKKLPSDEESDSVTEPS